MAQILRMLEKRPLSAAYLAKAMPLADKAIRSLERKRLHRGRAGADGARSAARAGRPAAGGTGRRRQPRRRQTQQARARTARLSGTASGIAQSEGTGSHGRNASPAARSLARKGLVTLQAGTDGGDRRPVRARHTLNPAQQAAFDQIREAIRAARFHTFLLHGVTGSGKTEVYLSAIEATLAEGRGALLLVPEIALTPAVAGQFFSRFGDRVAILHSAFTDVERSDQWRRIRSGAASVVVGTRSGVFAPVQKPGADRGG